MEPKLVLTRDFWEMVALAGRAGADGRERAAALILKSASLLSGVEPNVSWEDPARKFSSAVQAAAAELYEALESLRKNACRLCGDPPWHVSHVAGHVDCLHSFEPSS